MSNVSSWRTDRAGSEAQRVVLLEKDRRAVKELKKKYKKLEADQDAHRYATGRWSQISYEEDWAWEMYQTGQGDKNPQTRVFARWELSSGSIKLQVHHGDLKRVVDTYHVTYHNQGDEDEEYGDQIPSTDITRFQIIDYDDFFADLPRLQKQRKEFKRLVSLDWPIRLEIEKREKRIKENKNPIK